MLSLTHSSRLLLLVLLLAGPVLRAVESPGGALREVPFSSLTAKKQRGQHEVTCQYTRRESAAASQLRIVNQRKELPTPPYNLIDLRTGEVTILYPQNSTYLRVPAERFAVPQHQPAPFPGMPALPPGIGPRTPPGPTPAIPGSPAIPGTPAIPGSPAAPAIPALPDGVELPPGIGPQANPGAPTDTAPDAKRIGPSIPLPEGVKLPPGIGPGATPDPAQPAIPGLPPGVNIPIPPAIPLPGIGPAPHRPAELVKTGETRELHGHPCTRYTLEDPRHGTLEIWATDALGPFYLLANGPPETRRPLRFIDTWPALLRERGLFPLLAVRKHGDTESFRFEVTALDADPAPAMAEPFPVPPTFHQTELLDF